MPPRGPTLAPARLPSRPSLWTRTAPELFSWARLQVASENPLMVGRLGPPSTPVSPISSCSRLPWTHPDRKRFMPELGEVASSRATTPATRGRVLRRFPGGVISVAADPNLPGVVYASVVSGL